MPILYEICLFLLSLFQLPKMLYMRCFHQKYRHSLKKKFGYDFPLIKKGNRYLIWIHAVSVGETKAVAALAKKFHEAPNRPFLLVTSATETGHSEAQRSLPFADAHAYLPFDFGWIIKPLVKKVAPDMVILCESDFWYNFLTSAKNQGSKIVLVNGKVSDRSFKRFQKFSWFTKALFQPFDILCLQSSHYKERFLKLAIPAEKLQITGNIKFDDIQSRLSLEQLKSWKNRLGIQEGEPVLVVGSSHDPEEKLVLEATKGLWEKFPTLKVLIVPRHPERFTEVAQILEQRSIPFQRYSQLGETAALSSNKVVLIDAMGLLRICYQMADIALVCGSFTPKVGGHNIVEPSWYAVPVIFGPYMHAQPELLELVRAYKTGQQVSAADLQKTLQSLLEQPLERQTLGQAGLKLMNEMRGATHRTWQILQNNL